MVLRIICFNNYVNIVVLKLETSSNIRKRTMVVELK